MAMNADYEITHSKAEWMMKHADDVAGACVWLAGSRCLVRLCSRRNLVMSSDLIIRHEVEGHICMLTSSLAISVSMHSVVSFHAASVQRCFQAESQCKISKALLSLVEELI